MNTAGFAIPPDYGPPAPDSPFAPALGIYWPVQEVLDGTWTPPLVVRVV